MSVLAMQVHAPGGPLVGAQLRPEPPPSGSVRVHVIASGMCGADVGTARADGGGPLPVTPGHEVAGTIAEVGAGVTGWNTGDRVAVGWFGGSCGHCDACRRGDVVHCPDRKIPGISYPGGWAESIVVPSDTLARVPDDLDLLDAAPMGCAGVTTFNAVRRAGVPPGGRIGVLGLGGLGHLAVQFAAAMGYEVTVITRGPERADIARELGANHYLDSTAEPVVERLRSLGGQDAVISTAPAAEPVAGLLAGLRPRGRLVLLGVADGAFELPFGQLVMHAQQVSGQVTGSPLETEAAMRFAAMNGVRPVIERVPLPQAAAALDRLRSGEARFRIVLDTTAEPTR